MLTLCCDQTLIDFVNKAKRLDHNTGCDKWLLCLRALQNVSLRMAVKAYLVILFFFCFFTPNKKAY